MRKLSPLVPSGNIYFDTKDFSNREGHEVDTIVGHTTGGRLVELALAMLEMTTTAKRLKALESRTLSDKVSRHAARFYAAANAMSTTYVIGWHGERYQILPETVRAWSAGIAAADARLYTQGFNEWSKYEYIGGKLTKAKPERYTFWLDMYCTALEIDFAALPPFEQAALLRKASPYDLFDGRNPDLTAISVDFVAPPYMEYDASGVRRKGPNHEMYRFGALPYTEQQHLSFHELAKDIASEYPKYTLTRRRTLPHSATNPLTRSRVEKGVAWGWDPGDVNWSLLLYGAG